MFYVSRIISEPNSRLLIMVVSEDTKLYIYEETELLWSCDLLYKTISISRCFLKNLSGGLVTLSTNGIVSVSYLGTEPDLNSSIVPMVATAELKDIQAELEAVEEALERVMDNEGKGYNYHQSKLHAYRLIILINLTHPRDDHYS